MSGKVVGWAMRQRTGSPTTKLVLVKLADNSNEEGFCFPSLGLMKEHTELSERAVREHLTKLEALNLIWIERRCEGNVQLANHYWLNVENIPEFQRQVQGYGRTCRGGAGRATPMQPTHEPRHHMPHPPAGGAPPLGQDVPRSIEEPPKEPSREPALTASAGAREGDLFAAEREPRFEIPEFLRRFPPAFAVGHTIYPHPGGTTSAPLDSAVWEKSGLADFDEALNAAIMLEFCDRVVAEDAKRPPTDAFRVRSYARFVGDGHWQGLVDAARKRIARKTADAPRALWKGHAVGDALRRELGDGVVTTWLGPTELVVEDAKATIRCERAFVRDYVAIQLFQRIERAFALHGITTISVELVNAQQRAA